ncbi:hypothetical protein NC99_27240 [Sunxiuqinia dokdonensis]|uniref:Uncharacterized protein n=1 Tax=Sunxiuqinia dokdonensis TaxID=1409788 RepID=A0A0L8V7S1_9BACT|nr:hypothetical protein NC99_27240 [Sunxiuqinia dokdonensis]
MLQYCQGLLQCCQRLLQLSMMHSFRIAPLPRHGTVCNNDG